MASISFSNLIALAKTQKQPRCKLTDDWIKKVQNIYNRILFIHKKGNPAICNNLMDLDGIVLSEIIIQRKTNTI